MQEQTLAKSNMKRRGSRIVDFVKELNFMREEG